MFAFSPLSISTEKIKFAYKNEYKIDSLVSFDFHGMKPTQVFSKSEESGPSPPPSSPIFGIVSKAKIE